MTPSQCSLVITSLWIRVALACAQASAFRLPRFLPYVLVMLAGATYLCLRSPLYPPARPPPSASRQSSSMAMAKNGRPPALLPLSLSSRHPVYGVSVSEVTRQLYGWDVILEAGADIQLTIENARPGSCMCIIGVEFDASLRQWVFRRGLGDQLVSSFCRGWAGAVYAWELATDHGQVFFRRNSTATSDKAVSVCGVLLLRGHKVMTTCLVCCLTC